MSRCKRDATYRERWIDAVLWNDELTPMTKNVLMAMSRHMDDRGRVRRKHADLAAALQIKNPKHVGDRIREARNEGFLCHIEGTGYNRTVTVYDAMIPAKERTNAPQSPRATVQVPRNGGPENGGPEQAWDDQSRSLKTGDHYARAVLTKNREHALAPDGARVAREHDVAEQDGNYPGWPSTPSKSLPLDTRSEVA